jgi:excisionase family DNA binding protein
VNATQPGRSPTQSSPLPRDAARTFGPLETDASMPKIGAHTLALECEAARQSGAGSLRGDRRTRKEGRGASRPALGGRPIPLCPLTQVRAVKARRRHVGASASPALTALAVPEKEILEIRCCGHFCGHRCGRPQPTVTSMTTTYRILQAPEERLVYIVAEAGELLGISRAFAYELVARGELPVIRLGRRIVVPKPALLAMVDLTPQTL